MLTNDELLKKLSEIQGSIENIIFKLKNGGYPRSDLCLMDRDLAYLREEMNEKIREVKITCGFCQEINEIKKWQLAKTDGSRKVVNIRCPAITCRKTLLVEPEGRVAGIIAYAYPPLQGLFAKE